MNSPSVEKQETNAAKPGTFGGVFTPSILTIPGIILFLRTGFVPGNAGLMRMLFIVAIAGGISVLTSISIAAVATNLKVKAGGYAISSPVPWGSSSAAPGTASSRDSGMLTGVAFFHYIFRNSSRGLGNDSTWTGSILARHGDRSGGPEA